MHILVISDAWLPQVNGVVRTYQHLGTQLQKMGHGFDVIGPSDFKFTMPMPGYSEIRLALFSRFTIGKKMEALIQPDTHIHIATEGPMGKAAQAYCFKNNLQFSTCYHTEFPDYLAKRVAKYLPFMYETVRNFGISGMRKFHEKSQALFVATESLEKKLKAQGFAAPIKMLTRGVDFNLFHPGPATVFQGLERPIAVCVARVAIEKNLEAYFQADWKGTKVMVGSGPDLDDLKSKYPDVVFTGRVGGDLGDYYRSADIFAFPSKTDTFGMVMTEAMASGLPIAAYPVPGPQDIVTFPQLGSLNDDLSIAMQEALETRATSQDRYEYAQKTYTWEIVAKQFLDAIQ